MVWLHVLFVLLLVGTEAFFLVVDGLNLRYGRSAVRENKDDLAEQFNIDDPDRLLNYQLTTTGFSQLKGWIFLGLTLLLLYTGLFTDAVHLTESLPWGNVVNGTIFFLCLVVAGFLVSLPFSAFETFVIEEIFEFNERSWELWVKDKLKGLAITLIFTGLLTGFVLWFVSLFPNFWWLAAWALMLVFGLVMQVVYPRIIAPLFNSFKPIEEGELASAIEELFDRAGFHCSEIYSMDASRRSSHSNAYFIGFGRTKRVVLFDTLLDQMDVPNVRSVLAHELAHWKKGHVWKGIVRQALRTGVVFYGLYWLVSSPYLYQLFEVPVGAVYAGLILGGLVITPINRLLSPLENYFSIRDEREADRFAVEVTGDGESMVEALRRLVGENLSNPYPHPLYAAFNYTHPPIPDRVRHIENQAQTLSKNQPEKQSG